MVQQMADIEKSADEVAKSRKSLVAALLALAMVAAVGAGFFALGGPDGIADLLGGEDETATEGTTPTTPQPPAASETPATTPEESAEATSSETATETATTETDTTGTGTTPVVAPTSSTPAAATAPTTDQQNRMYWEQVASQEQIGKLVRNEIASFALGTVTKSGLTANVRTTATYRAGGSISGTMVLRDYSGVWYFSSITRDGHVASTPTGTGDTSIMATIVEQQGANQEIPTGIIDGGYKKLTVDSVSMGSGTASIKITLSGGTASPTAGTITCVSKTIGGVKHWFITSFAKN